MNYVQLKPRPTKNEYIICSDLTTKLFARILENTGNERIYI
jgi:hypothetical protein